MNILLHLLDFIQQLGIPIILMFDCLLVLLLSSYYLLPNCFTPSAFSLCICYNYLKPFIHAINSIFNHVFPVTLAFLIYVLDI